MLQQAEVLMLKIISSHTLTPEELLMPHLSTPMFFMMKFRMTFIGRRRVM